MLKIISLTFLVVLLSSCGSMSYWAVSNGWGTSRAGNPKKVQQEVVDDHPTAPTASHESNKATDEPKNQIVEIKEAQQSVSEAHLQIPESTEQNNTTNFEPEAADDEVEEEDEPKYTEAELQQAYLAEKNAMQSRKIGIAGIILVIIPITTFIGLAFLISSLILANRALKSRYITAEGLRVATNWRTINWVLLSILLIIPLLILAGILYFIYFF